MSIYDNVQKMWFGTERRMGWIDMPSSGAGLSPSGNTAQSKFLNGGSYVRNSIDSAKTYTFSWGETASRELASMLQAYAHGTYGRGLIHFIDPMFFETNILPRRWSDPSMAIGYEANPAISNIQPASTPTSPNILNLPMDTAIYTIPAGIETDSRDRLTIPIPDGYTLHIGAIYSSTSPLAGYFVRQGGSLTRLTPLGASAQNIVPDRFTGGVVTLSMRNGAAASAQVSATALVARLYPSGINPTPDMQSGPWPSGEGHSGCRFVGKPTMIGFTGINGGQLGISATLEEVGSWE